MEPRRYASDVAGYTDHDRRLEAQRPNRDWCTSQPRPRPVTTQDWVKPAKDARQQRSLTAWMRVVSGGPVRHTRLDRGSVTTATVHEFDDAREEFAEMFAWTEQPSAQIGPC